jgi:hypothetical protein
MNGLSFLYNFNESEKELFEESGLDVSKKINHGEQYHVGKIELENGYIDLSVTFMPASFWEAEIHSKVTGKTYKVATGSGSLTGKFMKKISYWEQMVKLVDGDQVKEDDMFEIVLS